MMKITNKCIDRIVLAIETEIDNIFDFKNYPDFDYKKEKIIGNHVSEILSEINDLCKDDN